MGKLRFKKGKFYRKLEEGLAMHDPMIHTHVFNMVSVAQREADNEAIKALIRGDKIVKMPGTYEDLDISYLTYTIKDDMFVIYEKGQEPNIKDRGNIEIDKHFFMWYTIGTIEKRLGMTVEEFKKLG